MNSPVPANANDDQAGRADGRLGSLREWTASVLGTRAFSLEPASNDASFRRYFRITPGNGSLLDKFGVQSLIAMDAPPDKEDCRPFVHVAEVLSGAGVNVPRVLAQDLAQGFLLLPDFGTTTFLAALNAETAGRLYGDAIAALVSIQKISRPGVFPPYDRALLDRELMLFPDWYVKVQRERTLSATDEKILRNAFDLLIENNLGQPQVFVHRDYHSRNLMVTTPNPGILDFQDAVYGPITYDLVSLLRDAYVSWEEEQVLDWCIRYWEAARAAGLPVRADFAEFYRDFEWMGAQRQLKVVGIFARLAHRDGKRGYLDDQPRVMAYLKKTCHRYRELGPLARLLDELDPVQQSTGLTF